MQVDERLKEKEAESIKLINGRQTTVKKKFLSKLQVTLNSESSLGRNNEVTRPF